MLQGPYGNPSISSLSLHQSNQSDPPNGTKNPVAHFPLMANRYSHDVKFL